MDLPTINLEPDAPGTKKVKLPSRYVSHTLSIQNSELERHVVSQWRGRAAAETRNAAQEALGELLSREVESVVIDVGELEAVSEPVIALLARGILEAQRTGRRVTLVRCGSELFRDLQRHGIGSVAHAASLLSATQGLAPVAQNSIDLYLRSTPEMLPRLRNVISAFARQAQMDDDLELRLKCAVTEATANAILHGSPEGPRNHVRVSFVVDGRSVIVEVADQGRGFDPKGVPAPVASEIRETGYGLHIMRSSMERVEFLQDDGGMLVRMTQSLAA